MTEKPIIMTPTLADLKFKFLAKPDGDLPSNCPPIRKKDGTLLTDSHALASYDVLGFYPVYKWSLWGFRDDKNFDWKASWESQCAVKGGDPAINVPSTIKSLDKMQRAELGELSTGATDMLGIIGQKAVRDAKRAMDGGDETAKKENLEIVARSMAKITDFIDYVDKGDYPDTKLKKDACAGNRKENCDDGKARGYLALSRIANAAIDSGFTNAMPDRDLVAKKMPAKSVAAASPKMLFRSVAIPIPSADPETITIDPDSIFKASAEALYQCVIKKENPDDSLPRDQCLEGIKDMAVVGIANQKDGVVKDALDNLGSNYKLKKTPEGEKLDDVATWVNSTVWMADGLIDAIQMEGRGIVPRDDKNVDKLIDTISAQKRETTDEFSTADWITQQVLIHTAKKGMTARHGKIIEKINGDRIVVWNSWLNDYLGQKVFDRCTEESRDCMSDDTSDALKSLSTSIVGGCLRPIIKDMKAGKAIKPEMAVSLNTCSAALAKIIEHSGNEAVLHTATDAYFLYGQEDGGVFFNKDIKKAMDDAFNKRFTPLFVLHMKGMADPSDRKKRQIAESVKTETDADGWLKEYWLTDMFGGRFFKKDEKGKPIFENYALVTKTRGSEFGMELARIL